jgi:hypothetical protein
MKAVLSVLCSSSSDTAVTEQVGIAVTLFIWEVLGLNLGWDTVYPKFLNGFS